MPIQLTTITAETRTVTVTIGGEQLDVTYRAGIVTPAWIDALNLSSGAGVVAAICETVTDWDLLEADGAHVPITPHRVSQLPRRALITILSALVYDKGGQ